MSRILALDIGTKRTGVAYLDEDMGIPLPLDTLSHASNHDLIEQVRVLANVRKIDRLVVGLPLLLSGKEGSQSSLVRDVGELLEEELSLPVTFIDERYSTPAGSKEPDAHAAVSILSTLSKG